MSTPHIVWAFAQRELTAAQRVVLIALAERANGERTCFPSAETLACDCELSRRSVISAVQYLHHERHLIEVVSDPIERAAILAKAGARKSARANVYRILRPADSEKSAPHYGAKSAPPHTTNGAKSAHLGSDSAKSAHLALSEGAKSSNQQCKKQHVDGAPFAPESLNESLNEKKRADFKSREQGKQATAPATAPPKAPVIGATNGSTPDHAIRPPTDPFADDGGESKAFASRILGRPVHLATNQPDAITEDDPPQTEADRARMAAQLAQLRYDLSRGMRHFAIPSGAERSPSDQQDAIDPRRPKAAPLSAVQLAAARRIAGIPVAANA